MPKLKCQKKAKVFNVKCQMKVKCQMPEKKYDLEEILKFHTRIQEAGLRGDGQNS